MDPKEYTDLKFENAVSENRALASEISSEFVELESLINSKPGLGWLIGIALAIVAAIMAMIQFGGSQFSSGYTASSSYAREMEQYRVDMLAHIEQTGAQIERTNFEIEQNSERLENIEALLIQIAAERQPEDP